MNVKFNYVLQIVAPLFRIYIITTSWEHNQQKGSVASINGAGGGLSPSAGDLGGRAH